MSNRLSYATSPYLLQHQDNPVHWSPWDDAAFDEAKSRNVPVLLSVGYAACHWCHVMAHESFENQDIAALVNRHFVAIKVDREERPDLDAIYQKALAALGQHGGWPLTMFLKPDRSPFWGGTYFPPEARWGRAGFPDVLKAVHDAWTNRRDQIDADASLLLGRIGREPNRSTEGIPGATDIDRFAATMAQSVDPHHGGLSGEPKFPHPGFFDRLWRSGLRSGDLDLLDAVTLTLDHMGRGGIYDHLGGGLMRYSTDAIWLVPHFEKMLYDNAQLVDLATLVWQSNRSPTLADTVAGIIGWITRDMRTEGGAFAATVDADDAGGEGHFYTWTRPEIDALLGTDAPLFAKAYDVTAAGNWEGRNILRRVAPPLPPDQEAILERCRQTLFEHRETRPRPARDDKILADWNGMMITALANAAFAFVRPDWLALAQTAHGAVRDLLGLDQGRLAHSRNLGQTASTGVLDDLVHMARAALALHEITGQDAYLQDAKGWAEAAVRHHSDPKGDGYFQSPADAHDIVVRLKPIHDAAVPAANGTLLEVFARLSVITGDGLWTDRALALAGWLGPLIPRQFADMTAAMVGLDLLTSPLQITVTGDDNDPVTRTLLATVAARALPNRVLIRQPGSASAMVCRNGTCSLPVTDGAAFATLLTAQP